MAHCSFTSDEKRRIDEVAQELDGTIVDFFGDARSVLSEQEWTLLTRYAASCVRRALEVGAMLRAVAEAGVGEAYAGRGRETFVRDALAAWRDSFAPVPDVWRLAPIFEKMPGGECRAIADVTALEVMATNRMFTSLDDQYQTFFASEQ